jgi:hypothetical protein
MKKTILSAAILSCVFAGCSGNKTNDEHGHEHGPGTHEHHDGADHHHSDSVKHHQEEFTVDTAKEETHEHPHSHDGHEHKH